MAKPIPILCDDEKWKKIKQLRKSANVTENNRPMAKDADNVIEMLQEIISQNQPIIPNLIKQVIPDNDRGEACATPKCLGIVVGHSFYCDKCKKNKHKPKVRCMAYTPKNCIECGEEFIPEGPRQLRCSKECGKTTKPSKMSRLNQDKICNWADCDQVTMLSKTGKRRERYCCEEHKVLGCKEHTKLRLGKIKASQAQLKKIFSKFEIDEEESGQGVSGNTENIPPSIPRNENELTFNNNDNIIISADKAKEMVNKMLEIKENQLMNQLMVEVNISIKNEEFATRELNIPETHSKVIDRVMKKLDGMGYTCVRNLNTMIISWE